MLRECWWQTQYCACTLHCYRGSRQVLIYYLMTSNTGHLKEKKERTAHTSTEREGEEPWGEGRQEKAESAAPGCRGWWSGEVGDDSTFGIPYIWFNCPTVTYSFTEATHTHRGGEEKGKEMIKGDDKQKKEQFEYTKDCRTPRTKTQNTHIHI